MMCACKSNAHCYVLPALQHVISCLCICVWHCVLPLPPAQLMIVESKLAGSRSQAAGETRPPAAWSGSHHTHRTSLYRFGNAEDTHAVLIALYPACVALLSPGKRCLTSFSPTRTTLRSGPLLRGSRPPPLINTLSGLLRAYGTVCLTRLRFHPTRQECAPLPCVPRMLFASRDCSQLGMPIIPEPLALGSRHRRVKVLGGDHRLVHST